MTALKTSESVSSVSAQPCVCVSEMIRVSGRPQMFRLLFFNNRRPLGFRAGTRTADYQREGKIMEFRYKKSLFLRAFTRPLGNL